MKNIEKKLRTASSVRLNKEERRDMRSRILAYMMKNPIQNQGYSFFSHFHHIINPLAISLTSIAFILISGGAVWNKAENTLPGDTLYGFKVNVTEEVQGVFMSSPKEKLLWNQFRVAKRLEEVKELASNGNLTEENAEKLEKALDSHLSEIGKSAEKLAKEKPEDLIEASNVLTPIIAKHEKDLKKVASQSEETKKEEVVATETETIDEELKTEETQELKMLETESITTEDEKEIKGEEKVIEVNKDSKTLDSIISKIQKESDSLDALTKEASISESKEETKITQ